MSNAPELDAAGLPEELSPLDQILHRGEANPRTRSGIMTLELLDTTPDWDLFRRRFDNASRKVLRLRQKVVTPTLPTAAPPRWVVDPPDFNLDFHLRRVRVPEPGTLRQVMDIAEVAAQSPLDILPSAVDATLIEGVENTQAALMVHLSHAVTDGVGGVEMFANLYDLERDPPPQDPAPLPIPSDLSPNDLMRQGITRLPGTIAGSVRDVVFGAAQAMGHAVRDPPRPPARKRDRLRDVGRPGDRSGRRSVAVAAPPQPVLAQRGHRHRVRRSAPGGESCRGGSINDAYLAGGVCGALRLYHQAKGVPVDTLPMAVPVNLRSDADPAGGNRFAGVNLAAPIGMSDPPEVRIKNIRSQRRASAMSVPSTW